MNPWLKLFDDLTYSRAMLRARKVQRDEAKLRELGGAGNYESVTIRLSFERLGKKLYSVWVKPL